MFGRVAESTTQRGEFFLFYSYAHISGRATSCLTYHHDDYIAHKRTTPNFMRAACGCFSMPISTVKCCDGLGC